MGQGRSLSHLITSNLVTGFTRNGEHFAMVQVYPKAIGIANEIVMFTAQLLET